jgi:predicted AAA+ superfamily ATPase
MSPEKFTAKMQDAFNASLRPASTAGANQTFVCEVDFVAERLDGQVLPIEVKFRRKIDPPDSAGLLYFRSKFESPLGIVVTRELSHWDVEKRILFIPLQNFLLAF